MSRSFSTIFSLKFKPTYSVGSWLIGWRDLALFGNFLKWTHCCQSGIFLGFQFRTRSQVFIFMKITGTLNTFILIQRTFTQNKFWNKNKISFFWGPPKWAKLFLTYSKENYCFSFCSFFYNDDIPPWHRHKNHKLFFADFSVTLKIFWGPAPS